jgi:hypothetical protein
MELELVSTYIYDWIVIFIHAVRDKPFNSLSSAESLPRSKPFQNIEISCQNLDRLA